MPLTWRTATAGACFSPPTRSARTSPVPTWPGALTRCCSRSSAAERSARCDCGCPNRTGPDWVARIQALHDELAQRRDGYQQAVPAHLVLLLVAVSRLAADVVGDLRENREPLLAEVFEVIERRYPQPLSLRDVATAVNISPGHLTSTVRRRTGRTVQAWITERRMVQARRLLAATELPISEVGRRVGFPDAGYFTRTFGKVHGISPAQWRRAGADPTCPHDRKFRSH